MSFTFEVTQRAALEYPGAETPHPAAAPARGLRGFRAYLLPNEAGLFEPCECSCVPVIG